MTEGEPQTTTTSSEQKKGLRCLRFNMPQYPEATFYLNRLADLLDLRDHLDTDQFPFAAYESVPIYPDQYSKGLRHGVLRAISGTYSMLSTMQPEFAQAAQRLVDFDRNRQGLVVAKTTKKQ